MRLELGHFALVLLALGCGGNRDTPPEVDPAPAATVEAAPNSPHVEHHPNGQVRSTVPLDTDGEPHGLLRAFYENGTPHFDSTYRHGERHGTTRFWHDNGTLESVRVYADGVKHGPFTDWHDNGVKAAEGEYSEDELVQWNEWDPQGRPVPEDQRVLGP